MSLSTVTAIFYNDTTKNLAYAVCVSTLGCAGIAASFVNTTSTNSLKRYALSICDIFTKCLASQSTLQNSIPTQLLHSLYSSLFINAADYIDEKLSPITGTGKSYLSNMAISWLASLHFNSILKIEGTQSVVVQLLCAAGGFSLQYFMNNSILGCYRNTTTSIQSLHHILDGIESEEAKTAHKEIDQYHHTALLSCIIPVFLSLFLSSNQVINIIVNALLPQKLPPIITNDFLGIIKSATQQLYTTFGSLHKHYIMLQPTTGITTSIYNALWAEITKPQNVSKLADIKFAPHIHALNYNRPAA